MAPQPTKINKGKRVIEMKRIESDNNRIVSFSKRKSGIYKKANELAVKTGAQVGFLAFSPSGKPYSFGHPSMEAISNRFLGLDKNVQPNNATEQFLETHRQIKITNMNQYHNELRVKVDVEKERGKVMEEKIKGKKTRGWWEIPTHKLSVEELVRMNRDLEVLTKIWQERLNSSSTGGATSSSISNPKM